MDRSLCVWVWEGKKSRSPDSFPLSKVGRIAEMMADGVEADMTFRDAEILEIRRRAMVKEQVHTMYRTPQLIQTPYPIREWFIEEQSNSKENKD
jgi:hypothetical protein